MVAGDEAGQRLYTAILVQRVYLSIGALVRDIFLDKQMAVGQCSDLRRMSDAEDLMALGALTQYLADTAGCFARYAGCPSERRYSANSSGSMDFISIFSVSSAISSHTAIEKAVRIIFLRQYEPLLLADKVRMVVKKLFRNILVFFVENGAGGV